jgi:3-dehydroquinate dehydratase/shikimate dehydrogenase
MICVSIGRGQHQAVIETHRELVAQGAKLVELRLDYLGRAPDLKRLLSNRPSPVVVCCRRKRDGGRWAGSEEERQMLLRAAIADGAEYVDLEEDIAGQIPRFGHTKRIISFHDFRKTPDDLQAIYDRMAKLDPDIIKIVTMANHPCDNFRMLRLVAAAKIPTIGFCMGEMGIPSRILTLKFGAPFTYASFSEERILAPGQLSFQQMKEIYDCERINRDTEVYGVIADPVGHSLSPVIHNAAFRKFGLNKVYVPIRVPREALRQFLEEAPGMGIKGLSVTIPHKEAVLEKLTMADSAVQGIGAANTIIFQNGEVYGYNTDYRAAMDSLHEALNLPADQPAPLAGKKALVLGAGGVGRAMVYGLLRRGAEVVVTDGDDSRAKLLAEQFGCRALEWNRRYSVQPDILINGTPVGMHPNVDETPYDGRYLRPEMLVFDAVYNPENTLLIKQAKMAGCKVITGVEMFVRQACLQFKLFTGIDGPADLMREVLKRAISPVKM